MSDEFYRIKRLPPYVFAEVNQLKARSRASGHDVIDFGMGNPDSPTPPHIVEKLREAVLDAKTHRYTMSKGIPGLRRAQANYYARRFGVDLNPESEVVVSIGSKEGLASLAQAITEPGDVILVPNPSYPIHPYGFVLSGASIWNLPKAPGFDFMTQLKRAIKHCTPKPIALVLNYPCNPTTEVVGLEFYEEVIDICKHHGIWVISDLAYCEIYFDGNPPPSILQVKGAKDIAIEFTTLSKTYSMAGWRVGFAVGNKKLVGALTRIKSYLDYGTFLPIQVAATAALNGPQECVEQIRELYRSRRDVLMEGLDEAGWPAVAPTASMFAWVPIPPNYADLGSLAFSKLLLEEAEVAVAPGIGFGEYGDGFVRIALVENKQRIRQAMRNVKHFLAKDPDRIKHRYGLGDGA